MWGGQCVQTRGKQKLVLAVEGNQLWIFTVYLLHRAALMEVDGGGGERERH